jgi:hypothetical protein
MKKKLTSFLLCCAVGTAVCSCVSSPTSPVQQSANLSAYGVFILNQGSTTISSTLDFLDLKTNKYSSNIVVSNASLGTDGNDLIEGNGDSLYMVMENSNRIYLVNDTTGTILATDTSSSFLIPYKMVLLNDSIGAIAEYNANSITIYDLRTMKVLRSIPVGDNPQGLAYANGKLYVACPGSGITPEKRVDIADAITGTDNAVQLDPDPIAVKALGDSLVLVLCEGTYGASPSDAALDYIDPNTGNLLTRIALPTNGYNFAFDGNDCYIQTGNVVLHVDIAKRVLADTAVANSSFQSLYAIAVDTVSHNIFVSDAKNYTSKGALYQCDNKGHILQTYTCGVNPGSLLVVH